MVKGRKGRKRCYFISPYLFQLTILGTCGILLCTGLTIYFLYDPSLYSFEEFLNVSWPLLIPLLCYLLVCIINAYEYFGIVIFSGSELTCYAPFKKTLVFQYSAIQEVGIDYVWLSVNKQFWIYVGNDKISHKYCHRINRLPINQDFVRFQFSEDVFNALLERLPHNLQKELYKSRTTVSMNSKGTHQV